MRWLELKIPPVALALLFAGAMWGVAHGIGGCAIPAARGLALALAIVGVTVAVLGVISFRRARTTVNPTAPAEASTLVIVGIYRWTRNPMYLGLLLVLAGWALWLGHALVWLLLPAFVAYLNRFQIAAEEAALTARFGPAFAAYQARVRRWL